MLKPSKDRKIENLKNKAVKSIFWIATARGAGQSISWVVTIVLIRILSPEDYGLMGLAMAYKAIVLIFYDFSIGEAVLQKKDLTEKDIYTSFWICISFSSILYIATWFLSITWATFFSNKELIPIVRVLGISLIVLSIKEIPNRLLAKEFEFKKRSFFELLASLLCLLTSLSLALSGHGVWSLVIGEVVKDISLTVFILNYLKWIPKLMFSISSARKLLRYGIPVTGYYILNYISAKSDTIIIGKVLGQSVLGYYSVALSLARIPVDKGIQIIQQVLFPLFSKIQDNKEECSWYYYKLIYLISVFFFPAFLGMFAVSEEIIFLILSPKWLPSLFVIRIFCLIGLMLSYTGIFLVILKSRGRTINVFKYSLFSAILFPLTHTITSHFGLTAIGIGWIIVFPLLFLYLSLCVSKEIDISIIQSIKTISNALFGSILMVIGVLFFKKVVFSNTITMLTFISNVIIGATIYICYFFFFSRNTFSDIKSIFHTLRN